MKNRLPLTSFLLFTVILLSACGPGQVFGPTITPSSTTTPTPTPTSTSTPTSTPTLTPTPTPTPIGGGSGFLVYGTVSCPATSRPYCIDPSIHILNLDTQQSTLVIDHHTLQGVSPDGTRLLIADEAKKLYLVNLDGSNPIFLHNNYQWSAAWLPGTDWIAFIASEGSQPQAFIIHPDGTGLTQVTESTIGVVSVQPVFDGGIYWEEGNSTHTTGYSWTKLDGSETRKSIRNSYGWVYTSDGTYGAYQYFDPVTWEQFLVITKTAGSELVSILGEIIADFFELPDATGYWIRPNGWTPDNKELLVSGGTCNVRNECEEKVFRFSRNGEILGEFAPEVGDWSVQDHLLPYPWSPDGRSFLIYQYDQVSGLLPFLIYHLDTGKIELVDLKLDQDTFSRSIFWLPAQP